MASVFDETIVAVFAELLPDGSIEVELLIPGQDDPFTATIRPIPETRKLAVPHCRQTIALDADGSPSNGKLRKLVSEFVQRAEQRRLDNLRAGQVSARA